MGTALMQKKMMDRPANNHPYLSTIIHSSFLVHAACID